MQKILKYTGIISTYIIICGVIKFYVYYKSFGISIIQFVELQEIFPLFLDNLIGFLPVMILMSSIYYMSLYKKTNSNRRVINIWWLIIIVYFIAEVFTCVYYFMFARCLFLMDIILIQVLLFTCLIVVPYLYISLDKIGKRLNLKIELLEITLIFSSIMLLGYAIAAAKNEEYKVKNDNYYCGVEIKMKEESKLLISNDSSTFIGNTKNYVFIYNMKIRNCTVYKMSDVETIKFPVMCQCKLP